MEFQPCSPDQKQAVMTQPLFLSGLEMRSAGESDFDHERFRSIALLAVKGPQIIALRTG
jgi:hypothetical protein